MLAADFGGTRGERCFSWSGSDHPFPNAFLRLHYTSFFGAAILDLGSLSQPILLRLSGMLGASRTASITTKLMIMPQKQEPKCVLCYLISSRA